MTGSTEDSRLDAALAAYLQAVDRSDTPEREEFLAGFPELRDELALALDALEEIEGVAAEMSVDTPSAAGINDPRPTLAPGSGAKLGEGQRVRYFGDYELIEEIARGGMGIVYRARQVSLNRPVALKMILDSSLASKEAVRRFHREAEAAASLDHENIVSIHEVGEHEGHCYFTMELLEKGSLAGDLASRVGDERGAAALMEKVARAVDHGHRRGILHRDLKPANILLDRKGAPRVCDFGLARREDAGDLTRTGAVLGTPSYMAPEQAAGRSGELTVATDVWSLGAILYELLTGRPPHTGASPLEIVRSVLESDPARPGDVSRDLGTIAMKCLQREPEKRYSTAADLADDLQRFLDGRPIHARPVGGLERTRLWIRRHPARAALIVSLIVGFLSVLFLNVRLSRLLESNRLYLYAADMRLAREAFEEHQVLRALELLVKHVPRSEQPSVLRVDPRSPSPDETVAGGADEDLRGLEWYELWRRCHAARHILDDHEGTVTCLAVAPDGRELVSCSADGWIIKWEVETGRRVTDRKARSTVTSISYSRDGARLFAAFALDPVQILDAGSLATIAEDGSEGRYVSSVVVSPDGDFLAIGGSSSLHDPETLAARSSFTGSARTADSLCAVSADSTLVATAGFSGAVSVWDVREGRLRRALREPTSAPLRRSDSRRDAWCAREDEVLYQWSTYGQQRATSSLTRDLSGAEIYSLAFSPASNLLAAGTMNGELLLWDADTGEELLDTQAHEARISQLAFSPDAARIATASWDSTVALWDVATGKRIGVIGGHTAAVYGLAFSPDGATLVTGSDDTTVRVWVVEEFLFDRRLRGRGDGLLELAAVSPDATRLATVGPESEAVRLWDAASRELLRSLGPLSATPEALAWSADGAAIAVLATGEQALVKVFDTGTGIALEELQLPAGESWGACAFSHGGSTIAVASHDRVLVHDLVGTRPVVDLDLIGGDAQGIAFTPDDELLVVASGARVSAWDWRSGEKEADAEPGLRVEVRGDTTTRSHLDIRSIAISPDGRHVAAGLVTGEIRIHALPDLDEVAILRPRGGWVEALEFSPDGRTLVSGSWSRTVHLWDLETGMERAGFDDLPHPALALRFSVSGDRLVAVARDGSVRSW